MAGRIPQHFIDDLLSRVDIVDVIDGYVPLKRAGRNHQARCPFHDEKTPSFTVSQDKQFYHCFGCGANGTAIGFLMEYAGMTFPEAIEELANRAGLTVPHEAPDGTQTAHPPQTSDRTDLYELMELAVRYYTRQLREHPQREQAVAYLKERGVTGELAAEYEIGFAPEGWDNIHSALGKSEAAIKRLAGIGLLIEKDSGRGHYDRFRDRIMFPIRDRRGRAIGFGGRVLGDGEPKYLNSPETPIFHKGSEVYGLFQAKKALRQFDRLYVVEGYMDVLALAGNGVRNAVATLGTACTKEHLELLFRSSTQIVFCFDGDAAGQKAAFRAMETTLPLLREGREIDFLFMPPEDDPDTFIRREGQAAFTDPARLTPLSDYLLQYLRSEIDTSTREGKARLADRAIAYTRMLPSESLRDLLVRRISDITLQNEYELRSRLGEQAIPTARAPRAAAASRHAPSLVGHTIALLLHQPALALEIQEPRGLAQVDMQGMEFLVELLEFIHANPQIRTAGILEHWRDSRYARRLGELAGMDFDEQVDLNAEFRDCVTRLQKLQRRQRLQALKQMDWKEMSESQKEELRALTSATTQPE